MIDLLARFSPRLRAMLALLREVEDLLVTVEDVIHDKGRDPKVQRALNQIKDIRRKFNMLRGG
jgi:hypothetical protein|tara:strand:- start:937 stop:1125 length:189 start_codon:yes stop_codon:yes gene_type:complete